MCRDLAAPETVPWWAMARSTCSRRRSITVALSSTLKPSLHSEFRKLKLPVCCGPGV